MILVIRSLTFDLRAVMTTWNMSSGGQARERLEEMEMGKLSREELALLTSAASTILWLAHWGPSTMVTFWLLIGSCCLRAFAHFSLPKTFYFILFIYLFL